MYIKLGKTFPSPSLFISFPLFLKFSLEAAISWYAKQFDRDTPVILALLF